MLDSPLQDSFSGGVDADLVTCAVLSEATPAGLATFSANNSANAALITQLLGDVTLMRDMLVAGGARASSGGRGEPSQAQYGPAMKLYTQMLKESSVLADAVAIAVRGNFDIILEPCRAFFQKTLKYCWNYYCPALIPPLPRARGMPRTPPPMHSWLIPRARDMPDLVPMLIGC